MKCHTCQKLVHFYGAGELNDRKARQVESHLKECPACREVAEEVRNLAATVRSAQEIKPVSPHPEISTAAILRAIRLERTGRTRKSAMVRILESLLDWVGTPVGRSMLIGAALLIVGLFIAQEALILHRLSRLEQIVESGSRPGRIITSRLSISEVLNALDAATSGDKEKLRTVLRQIPTDSLGIENQRLRMENDLLKQLILEHLPELNRYLAGKSVTARELETLLRNYPENINLLHRL